MKVSKTKVIKLLEACGCEQYEDCLDKEIWISKIGVIIRLPKGHSIDYDLLEIIASEQLELGMWELDYYIGQFGIA